MSSLNLESLHRILKDSNDMLAHQMRDQWQRDLPHDELLSNRWERAKLLGFGAGSSVYHNCYVYGEVIVGENTWIGPFTVLDGTGGLTIGSYCSISAGTHIYTHDSVKWALSGGKHSCERSSVQIGDCTYVGSQVVIAKNTVVGDHVVVGAGSFVNRDIPSYTVVAGSPAHVIGRVKIHNDEPQLIFDRSGITNEDILR